MKRWNFSHFFAMVVAFGLTAFVSDFGKPPAVVAQSTSGSINRGDNLGNHIATQDLEMRGFDIVSGTNSPYSVRGVLQVIREPSVGNGPLSLLNNTTNGAIFIQASTGQGQVIIRASDDLFLESSSSGSSGEIYIRAGTNGAGIVTRHHIKPWGGSAVGVADIGDLDQTYNTLTLEADGRVFRFANSATTTEVAFVNVSTGGVVTVEAPGGFSINNNRGILFADPVDPTDAVNLRTLTNSVSTNSAIGGAFTMTGGVTNHVVSYGSDRGVMYYPTVTIGSNATFMAVPEVIARTTSNFTFRLRGAGGFVTNAWEVVWNAARAP